MMRTTLTLDDDVAVRLERLRKSGQGLKSVVNAALRAGLTELERGREGETAFSTRTYRLGAKVTNLDDIGEVLAPAEAEDWH